jgi:hypothetical protein
VEKKANIFGEERNFPMGDGFGVPCRQRKSPARGLRQILMEATMMMFFAKGATMLSPTRQLETMLHALTAARPDSGAVVGNYSRRTEPRLGAALATVISLRPVLHGNSL